MTSFFGRASKSTSTSKLCVGMLFLKDAVHSTPKIYQWDFLEVLTLKCPGKEAMANISYSFERHFTSKITTTK